MTQEQAKEALKRGEKITCIHFMTHEFIWRDPKSGALKNQNGLIYVEHEFWLVRKDMKDGWSIYNSGSPLTD